MAELYKHNECHFCKHKQNVPGTTHIKCTNPDPEMKGDKHGIKKGWFFYPQLFDPVWKKKRCQNFEQRDNE